MVVRNSDDVEVSSEQAADDAAFASAVEQHDGRGVRVATFVAYDLFDAHSSDKVGSVGIDKSYRFVIQSGFDGAQH